MGNKYITIIDNLGRSILGVELSQTAESVTIQNPVMISVQPAPKQDSNQPDTFRVQLIPLFLTEFIKPENNNRSFTYTYSKSSIALGHGFLIDDRIINQYDRMQDSVIAPQPVSNPEVIKLFDDSK